MRSRNLVYRIFNFDMYSFVIKIAILVNKGVLLEIIIPAPRLIKAIDELPTADPAPTIVSVVIINSFFFLNFLYFFL